MQRFLIRGLPRALSLSSTAGRTITKNNIGIGIRNTTWSAPLLTQLPRLFSTSAEPVAPELPENLTIPDLRVLDKKEEEDLNFQYITPEGPLMAPLMKLDNSFSLERVGDIELNRSIFGAPVRRDIIQRVVKWQLAKRRKGNAKAKNISERSGTGRKPHAQKGTGKARQGTRRAVHMKKGGRVHAPTGKQIFAFKLQKKVRRYALRSILSARFIENQLYVVESLSSEGIIEGPLKTKHVHSLYRHSDWNTVYFIDANQLDEAFQRASKNHPKILIHPTRALNAYDLMKHTTVVITRAALEELDVKLDESKRPPVFY